ncbi:MAG: hypothetical protein AAF193_05920, partial [Bacteroidota bacterium]
VHKGRPQINNVNMNMNQEPFKEEYWEDALKVLKQQERKAFIAKWWPMSIVIMAVIGSGLFALTNTNETLAQPVVTSQPQMLIASSFGQAFEAIPNTSIITSDLDESQSSSKLVDLNLELNQAEDETQTSLAEGASTEQQKQPATLASSLKAEDPSKMSKEETSSVEPQDRIEENKSKAVNTVLTSNEGNTKETNETGPESLASNQNPEANTAILKTDANEQKSIAIANKTTESSAASVNNVKTSLLALQRRYPDYQRKTGQLWTRQKSQKQVKREERFKQFNRISSKSNNLRAWIGSAFLTGYGTEAGLVDWNPSFGLMIDHKLSQNWWVEGGIGLQMINGVRYKAHFYADELTFGRNSTRTTVATQTLYILDAPFVMVRDFNQRHAMFIGANIEYLINTKSQLSRAYITNGAQEDDLGSEDAFGYKGGLQSVQFAPRIGYKYRFSKRVDVSFYRQFGWLNVNNGVHFRDNGNDFNTRWNVQFNFMLR